ncbi:MAG: Nif3-like dinuclear metal center hexameric protein [Planctomycetaceae bacterium]
MPRIADVSAFLRDFAPPALAEEWDNVGFLVGDEERDCARVMTCLTLTPDVAEEAVWERMDLVVSHHPLMFRPVQRLTADSVEGAMLLELIAAGVAVFSPHTGYDSASEGINRQLAERLGLLDVEILRERAASLPEIFAVDPEVPVPLPEVQGAGRCGRLPEPTTLGKLIELVKRSLGVSNLQYVGPDDARVARVAVACGSAAEFIPDALARDCEALVTGEARFHACLEARARGLALVLPGHYATERPAMERLAATLAARFPEVAVRASEVESDPVNWA